MKSYEAAELKPGMLVKHAFFVGKDFQLGVVADRMDVLGRVKVIWGLGRASIVSGKNYTMSYPESLKHFWEE